MKKNAKLLILRILQFYKNCTFSVPVPAMFKKLKRSAWIKQLKQVQYAVYNKDVTGSYYYGEERYIFCYEEDYGIEDGEVLIVTGKLFEGFDISLFKYGKNIN